MLLVGAQQCCAPTTISCIVKFLRVGIIQELLTPFKTAIAIPDVISFEGLLDPRLPKGYRWRIGGIAPHIRICRHFTRL